MQRDKLEEEAQNSREVLISNVDEDAVEGAS